MARFVAGAVFGLVVGVVAAAAADLRAQDLDGEDADVALAASEAGVGVQALRGAMSSTGLSARAYLYMTGELEPPKPPPPPRDWIDRLLDCLAYAESHNTPTARNPRSGASGLLQFLPSTFAGTPQGRAGMSIWDPAAQRAAGRWMINQGRLREWATAGMCS